MLTYAGFVKANNIAPQQKSNIGLAQAIQRKQIMADDQQNSQGIDAMSRLFPIGATIGSFFAGFTLNIVVAADSREKPEVRLYASIGSLLFVLLVLLSSAGDFLFPLQGRLHPNRERRG